ncbi:MAG: NADH-quinone oxidoreductase subunit A [Cyclobacteriaceae bacterium]|jgi:NADH-quinone oxidoreductase subunit A
MEISGFGVVLLFLIGGGAFISITLLVGRFLRPNRPSPEKLSTYESGEDPVNSAWVNFNVRYYVIALIFLLFELELVFLFPWGVVFGDVELIASTGGLWGWFSLTETFIFIGMLAVGLIYVWSSGMLDWIKPNPKPEQYKSGVPTERYQELNRKYQ